MFVSIHHRTADRYNAYSRARMESRFATLKKEKIYQLDTPKTHRGGSQDNHLAIHVRLL